ncbi:Predicted ATPase [Pedobacter steynii]|uniref:Predicted ATPase n=1 Tax=Pedobacter steynii TaxID=430522 RepID=A0A1G9WP09_9SPHI|nr:AAA family ATPase [Pedobacter steynii]NQX40345.1 AAA family ATPase [Pedobacter steynii]SDM85913.1 Predicted ATPase [Pedobacter steynii]
MKTVNRKNFFVITGGPGMGKTSLIEEMTKRGYTCVPETGRQIIIHQMNIKGIALPWKSPRLFGELMFRQAHEDFLTCGEQEQPVFFDRGIPDVIGYMELCRLQPGREMKGIAKNLRYHPFVFITPPWEEIYRNDTERKQTFAEAVETYEMMRHVYTKLGYDILEIPKISITERADFLVKTIGY